MDVIKKQLIKGEDSESRKKIFEEFGYNTLVIWEHELKNIEEVKLKINEFNIIKNCKELKKCLA